MAVFGCCNKCDPHSSKTSTLVILPVRSMEAVLRQRMMSKVQLLFVVAVLGSGLRGAAAATAAAAADQRRKERNNVWNNVEIHAWLMWSSMGFLFPLGAILIRFNRALRDSNACVSPPRARLLLYLHSTVQCGGVGAATAGIVLLITELGANFRHTHMRLGLALWIIVMVMPVISVVRPPKGTQWRRYWLFVHWLFGTGAVVLGIVNCFIGIAIYQRFHGSIRSLNIAFSVQIAFMALVYLLQDRLGYILGQGSKDIPRFPGKIANHGSPVTTV